jgi:hypothetical protein
MDKLPDLVLQLILEYVVSGDFRQIFKMCSVNKKIRRFVKKWVWRKQFDYLRISAIRPRNPIHGEFEQLTVNDVPCNRDMLSCFNGGWQRPRLNRPTVEFVSFIVRLVKKSRPKSINLIQERHCQNNQTGLHHLINPLIALIHEKGLKVQSLTISGVPYYPSWEFPLKTLIRSCAENLHLTVDSIHKFDNPWGADSSEFPPLYNVKYLDVMYFCVTKDHYTDLYRNVPNLERIRTVYALPYQFPTTPSSPRTTLKFLTPVLRNFVDFFVHRPRQIEFGVSIPLREKEYDRHYFMFEFIREEFLREYRDKNIECFCREVSDENRHAVVISIASLKLQVVCVKFNVLDREESMRMVMMNAFE